MLPLTFKQSFDIDFVTDLYQRLQQHDDGITLILRTKSGRKTEDIDKACIGEIRSATNKALFAMNHKEGIVHYDKAGSLQEPLLAFLKERQVAQQPVKGDLATVCTGIYVALISIVGLIYANNNDAPMLYMLLLTCLALTLLGLTMLSHAYKPDQRKWSLPAIIVLAIGALPTAPASLLVLPMISTFGQRKLQRLLKQDEPAASVAD
ncbi:hypothetical protein [Halomonas salipaludis]|uniref:Uncharacterized protein n=1 Tax=Halomonas salipaludis TaxID=2032625 RepID=A0A2A2F1J0_9GAMM|nr:hypothetical protein [Halomonas salipaludis]PAU79481.1 hypothetical protein CK498_03715 [Halomonas salipaludis]